MGEDDFRKMEQAWLDAAAVPELPALREMFSEDFMGTSFGGGVLSKSDVVPANGMSANYMPKCTLKDSTVRIFGDTAALMGDVEMQIPQKAQEIRMTTVFQKHADDWQIIAVHVESTGRPAVESQKQKPLTTKGTKSHEGKAFRFLDQRS